MSVEIAVSLGSNLFRHPGGNDRQVVADTHGGVWRGFARQSRMWHASMKGLVSNSASCRGILTCKCWGSRFVLRGGWTVSSLSWLLLERGRPSRSLRQAIYPSHTLCTLILVSSPRDSTACVISDHWSTKAVYFLLHNLHKFSLYLTGSTIHLCSVARNSDH
jgi:hypothetical protein